VSVMPGMDAACVHRCVHRINQANANATVHRPEYARLEAITQATRPIVKSVTRARVLPI
jgi:hypothetical protein